MFIVFWFSAPPDSLLGRVKASCFPKVEKVMQPRSGSTVFIAGLKGCLTVLIIGMIFAPKYAAFSVSTVKSTSSCAEGCGVLASLA
jgi:hypothetical protein